MTGDERTRTPVVDGVVSVTLAGEPDGEKLRVRDTVEQAVTSVRSSEFDAVAEVSDEAVEPPVDAAVRCTTDSVEIPVQTGSLVRAAPFDPEVVGVEPGETVSFDDGSWLVEVEAPMKLFVRVDGPVTVDATGETTAYSFGGRRSVVVAARSLHDAPAGTVTVDPDDFDSLAAGVSALSSAIKAPDSPERSWPTLRGHPPLIERGDSLEIPEGLEPPDTGVTLRIPPDLSHLLPAAPLAFYLGAGIECDDDVTPHLATPRRRFPLEPAFQATVARTLRRVFYCDCTVRTVGLYRVETAYADAVADLFEADLRELYDAAPARRLEAYMTVSDEVVTDAAWPVNAYVEPTPESLQALPHLVSDLATVRVPRAGDGASTDSGGGQGTGVGDSGDWQGADVGDGATADAGDRETVDVATATGQGSVDVVEVPRSGARLDVWVGDGVPATGSKYVPASYRARARRRPSEEGLTVEVVCLDDRMLEEVAFATDAYSREPPTAVPYDTNVHAAPTVRELRRLFRADTGLVHVVGHVDETGVRCSDGHLDLTTLDDVGTEAFVLNACRSYEQGLALCENGAVAGVMTTEDVPNEAAVAVGRTLARFLDAGFPVHAAASFAREFGPDREARPAPYVVVGDGLAQVTTRGYKTPDLVRVLEVSDDSEVGYEIETYTTHASGTGGLYRPILDGVDRYSLVGETVGPLRTTSAALRQFAQRDATPVVHDGDLTWSADRPGTPWETG